MNKSLLKFFTDFGPLLIFFTIYYRSEKDLGVAIPPLIIATLIAISITYFIEKKIPYIPLIGGVLISFFGDDESDIESLIPVSALILFIL